MTARKTADPEPEQDPEEVMLSAVRRWRVAAEAYTEAKGEADSARRDLVAALHDLGIEGFSL